MKLLYIGHSYHLKTKSTRFLVELLKEKFELEECDIDPFDLKTYVKIRNVKWQHYDILVCFQVMPDIKEVQNYCSFKRGVLFPMADYFFQATPISNPIWQGYHNFQIINFSKQIHDILIKHGFSSKYIQYFPRPEKVTDWGDKDSVYFWQRCSQINLEKFGVIFNYWNLKKIHLHKAMDPGFLFDSPPPQLKPLLEYSSWYETKEKALNDMDKFALYMAPRFFEGIGMSFLEAMAHGRCVVAPDTATMNEYITNGENGLLYSLNISDFSVNCLPPVEDVAAIQKRAYAYIENGYKKWQTEKYDILKWVQGKPVRNEMLLSKTFRQYYGDDSCIFQFDSGHSFKQKDLIARIRHKVRCLFWKVTACLLDKESAFVVDRYFLFGVIPVFSIKFNRELCKYKFSLMGIPLIQIKKRNK